MKERPILFSGPMVRAILAGKKSQTRRIVKNVQCVELATGELVDCIRDLDGMPSRLDWDLKNWELAPYSVGTRLWVRETWRTVVGASDYGVLFAADDAFVPIKQTREAADQWVQAYNNGKHWAKWRPSIFLPRCASRLTLDVTSVRVERLHAITDRDAVAEGVEANHDFSACERFAWLWESINGKRAAWATNPWVWVVEFRRALR